MDNAHEGNAQSRNHSRPVFVVDAVLSPVIGRQTIKRGRNLVVKLGDKEVDYSPNFKLYLQTKLSNPHYPYDTSHRSRDLAALCASTSCLFACSDDSPWCDLA